MSAVSAPARYKLSVDDYHKLGAAGVLHEDSRVELIEGELIQMAPIGSRHAAAVAMLHEQFHERTGGLAVVWQQNPVTLRPRSEPQPDLALLKFRHDRYAEALPTAADVLLIVEVADTTVDYDRGEKLQLYASHGITEYWIVDLRAKRVEIYREPHADGYKIRQDLASQGTVSPKAMPQVSITFANILG